MSDSAPADDPVGDALRHLVRDFGRLIGREPERVRSFIKDLLGDRGWTYRRNAEAVIQAAEFGVPDILLSGRSESTGAPVRDRFRDNGFSPDEADYGINAWAKALSVDEIPPELMPTSQGRPSMASQAATVTPGSDVTVVPGSDVIVRPATPPPGAGTRPTPLPGTELAGSGGPAPHARPASAGGGAAGGAAAGGAAAGGAAAGGAAAGGAADPDATVVPAHLTHDPSQPGDRQVRLGAAPKTGLPTDTDPAIRPQRSRRKPILIAAAAVVVVLVGAIIAAVTLSGGSGTGSGKGGGHPASSSGVAMVLGHAAGLGTATIVRDATTIAVSGATPLRVGDRVSAVTGPVQIDTGDNSVLRLDKAAEVLWSKTRPRSTASSDSGSPGSGTSSTSAAAEGFQVVKGRVYANVSSRHLLVLHTVATAQARVGPGRIVIDCVAQCSYQALEETQQVQPQAGPLITLQAHQRVTVDSAGKATRQLILPDVLRGDSFIASNVTLDGKQRLTATPIAGPSVLGPWAIKVLWQGGAAAHRLIYRQLTFSVDCGTGRCALKAAQTPAPMTCPAGTSCPMDATVIAESDAPATGDSDAFPLNFGARQADCSGDGAPDGTETTTADVRMTGEADGHRTSFQATYHTLFKASGPTCSQSYLATPDYDIAVGRPGKPSKSDLPQPAAEENLLNRNIRTQSECTRSAIRPAGATAAILCTPARGQPDPDKRPATMLMISFSNAASLRAAYNAQLSALGGATNYGTCAVAQSCERQIRDTTGRLSILAHSGTTDLIAYAPEQSLALLIAKGFATTAVAYPWFVDRLDAYLPWLPIAHF